MPSDYTPPVVPLYVITGGRADPGRNTLRPETLLRALPAAADAATVTPEQLALLRMCRGVLSLSEAAAHLNMPISVVRVLASALMDTGLLTAGTVTPDAAPSTDILREVLNGLRNLT
jgi:hypothetical protein